MENILLKYKQNTSYAKCFEILESKIAFALGQADLKEMVLILKQEVLDRLSLVNPALKTKSHLYTYVDSLLEITKPEHPLSDLFTQNVIDAIEKEWHEGDNTGKYEDKDFYISCIRMETVRAFLELENAKPGTDVSRYNYANYDMYFLCQFYSFKFDEEQDLENHISRHSIHKEKHEIIEEYFSMTVGLYEGSNEFYKTGLTKNSTTAELADNHTRYEFERRLEEAVEQCINLPSSSRWGWFKNHITWKHNFAHVFEVLSNIANLTDTEWTKFITGYYTVIPHIKRKKTPKIAIISYPKEERMLLEPQPCEVIIKGESHLIHLIIDKQFGHITTFDKYDLTEEKTIRFAGMDLEVNPECIEGNHLTLYEMFHIGNENIKVSTNFKIDTRTFKYIALSSEKGNPYETYMQDRAGLHNRKM